MSGADLLTLTVLSVEHSKWLRLQAVSLLGGGGFLACFLGLLGLLLNSKRFLLDALNLLNHEGAGDAVLQLLVSENTAVGARHSAGAVRHAAELGRTARLQASLGDAL